MDKKTRQQLDQSASSNIKQILEAPPYKVAAVVRPLTTHHEI